MSDMETLVQILDDAIKQRDVNVSALARDCGCSRQHIYQIVRGQQQPSLAIAEQICRALGAELCIKKKKSKKAVA